MIPYITKETIKKFPNYNYKSIGGVCSSTYFTFYYLGQTLGCIGSGYLKRVFEIETEFGILGSFQILLAVTIFIAINCKKLSNKNLEVRLINPSSL